jgi:hypothetical protein
VILVRVGLSASRSGEASRAQLWIEPNESSSIGETEIVLASNGEGRWVGRIPSQLLGPSGDFLYRVALSTAPGAIWSLQLVDEETSCSIASDSDVIDGCKAWLVGSASRARPRLAAVRSVSPAERGQPQYGSR